MSAYGAITRKSATLQLPAIWKIKRRSKPLSSDSDSWQYIVTYHLTLESASQPSRAGLLDYLHTEFADEVERGATYPQEALVGERLTRDAFESYFFAADVILGLVVSGQSLVDLGVDVDALEEGKGKEEDLAFDKVREGKVWADCVAGLYYIKPNYPGRSSHICNAGFLVPFASRGRGLSMALARSYLHYAPRLGYQASVFNLVYVNNLASVRIWENLGFTKAGRIPRAGRLKRKDGQGEEYVDALVFYKSFEDEIENPSAQQKSIA